jgi:hypothetical protein
MKTKIELQVNQIIEINEARIDKMVSAFLFSLQNNDNEQIIKFKNRMADAILSLNEGLDHGATFAELTTIELIKRLIRCRTILEGFEDPIANSN